MEKLEFRPDVLGLAAQDPDAGGVEGGDPHGLGPAADQRLDAFPHFGGGLVGEGDGQDLAVVGPPGGDQVGDPVAEHAGLARAGAGHDQQGAAGVLDGLFLLRVQPLQQFAGVRELRAVPRWPSRRGCRPCSAAVRPAAARAPEPAAADPARQPVPGAIWCGCRRLGGSLNGPSA